MEQVERDLPMLVWLRGDEPYFNEFSWDAEKVMETLGIKRSRLNQISGKDLRVGRTRINSYIRPIFRPVDVEEYLEWTRPTASHKKSSVVLEEARQKLETRSEQLVDLFSSQTEDFAKSFKTILQTKLNHQFLSQKHQLKRVQDRVSAPFRHFLKRQSLLMKVNRAYWENVLTALEPLRELVSSTQFVKVALTKLSEIGTSSENALQNLQKDQARVREELQEIKESMRELRRFQEEGLKLQEEDLKLQEEDLKVCSKIAVQRPPANAQNKKLRQRRPLL